MLSNSTKEVLLVVAEQKGDKPSYLAKLVAKIKDQSKLQEDLDRIAAVKQSLESL